MGQKVNPHGLRVGVIKDWDSRWFANKSDFGDTLVEDYPHSLCKAGRCDRPRRCRDRKAACTAGKNAEQAGLCQHRRSKAAGYGCTAGS